ncbi:hypothetical protein JW926_02520 [Candidatus Sumerlaeota bacterium]|nr:hypothetical protein [Candidatus Sumerlaeota bacterium]
MIHDDDKAILIRHRMEQAKSALRESILLRQNSNTTLGENLSADLHKAFEFRQESDYHAMEPLGFQETDEIIQNATSFVNTVETYLEKSLSGNKSADDI